MNSHKRKFFNRLYAIAYEDDGPVGLCGQSCAVMNPWHKLYLFETEEKMREYARKIEQSHGRKNPRIVGIYYPEPVAVDSINFIEG